MIRNKSILACMIITFAIVTLFLISSCVAGVEIQMNDKILNHQENTDSSVSVEKESPQGEYLEPNEYEIANEEVENPINNDVIIHQDVDVVIFRVVMWRTLMDAYHFAVSNNGVLEASRGTLLDRYSVDLSKVLDDTYEKTKIQLTKSELEYLLELANEIEQTTDADEVIGTTGWRLYISYNDTFYQISYYGDTYENFCNKLLVLSDLKKPDFWDRKMEYYIANGWEPGHRPPRPPRDDYFDDEYDDLE